jgi:hypothetical protein
MTDTTTDLNTLLATGRTFGAIYADPPWRYDKHRRAGCRGEALRRDHVTSGATHEGF